MKKLLVLGLVFIFLINFVYAWDIGESEIFIYTGSVQNFYAPVTGTYYFELWGAQGGNTPTDYWGDYGEGGKGAFVDGEIYLTEGQLVRFYVGGQGSGCSSGTCAGGWNGGGIGLAESYTASRAAGGGGATDIRIGGTSVGYRALSAAGGGGGVAQSGEFNGGAGGCTTGGDGSSVSGDYYGKGATSSSSGCAAPFNFGDSTCGGLNVGGPGRSGETVSGGGSGLLGGGGGGVNAAGGGGISLTSMYYISSSWGWSMPDLDSNFRPTNAGCVADQKSGHGQAKVTLLSVPDFFEITLKDGETSGTLSGFSATVSDVGSFSTTGTKITTSVEQPNTLTKTVTVAKSGYFTREYNNYNLNNDLEAQLHRLITSDAIAFSDSEPYIFGAWAEQDIFITLSCNGHGGIGCNKTHYCIDETNTCFPNQVYGSTIQFSTEGTRYIRFHSMDNANNWNTVQSKTLRLEYGEPPVPTDHPCEKLAEPVPPGGPEVLSCIAASGNVSTFYFNQSIPDLTNLKSSHLMIITSLNGTDQIDYDLINDYNHNSFPNCNINNKIEFKIESDEPLGQIRLYCKEPSDWVLIDTINNGGYIFTPGFKHITNEPDYNSIIDNVLPIEQGNYNLEVSFPGYESKTLSGSINLGQSLFFNVYLNPIYSVQVKREQTGELFSFIDRIITDICEIETTNKTFYETQLDANLYECSGTWNSDFPCEDAYDGIYTTYGVAADGQVTYLFADYVKPVDATINSYLRVKRDFLSFKTYNMSEWSTCWGASSTIKFRFTSDRTMNRTVVSCYDGSEWIQMDTYQNSGLLFGEEMIWAYEEEVNIDEDCEIEEEMSIHVKIFCEDSVIENTLTKDNNELTGINCPYKYWFIRADYSTQSYYRTLIPDYDDLESDIYMLDLRNDSAVQIIFIVDDYHGNYDQGRIILKKFVAGNLETVIEQYLDMEFKTVMWVQKNEVYQVYIVDNYGNESYIGDLVSDQASTKYIDTMNLITHGGSSNIPNRLTWDYSGDKSSGIVTLTINDGTTANLNLITWKIVEESTGAIIDEKTSTSKQASLSISGLNKERSYTSILTIDTDLRTQPIIEERIVWVPSATVFEGWGVTVIDSDGNEFNRTSEIIKLLFGLLIPILFLIIFSHSTIELGMTMSLVFFTIFNSLNWYNFLLFGGGTTFNILIWGINVIFAVMVFIAWHKKA